MRRAEVKELGFVMHSGKCTAWWCLQVPESVGWFWGGAGAPGEVRSIEQWKQDALK